VTAIPIRWIVRVGVSALVIAVLLALVPVRILVDAIVRVQPGVWLAVVVVFLACHVAAALKWRLLMVSASGVTRRLSVSAHFSGLIANLGLPGVTGGDIVRAAVVMRSTPDRVPVALASVADRLIDFAALLTLSFVGLVLAGPRAGDPMRVIQIVALVASAVIAAAVAGYMYLRGRSVPARLTGIVEAAEMLVRRPALVLLALSASCAVQATLIALNWQLGRAVGLEADFAVWLLAWPLAKLVALVPISLAGLGVREASLIGLMRPFGVPPAGIVAAGLLWQSVLMAGGLVGFAVTRLLPHRPAIQPQGATAP
jgi:glycosyltransferase 2 family protein